MRFELRHVTERLFDDGKPYQVLRGLRLRWPCRPMAVHAFSIESDAFFGSSSLALDGKDPVRRTLLTTCTYAR